MAKETDITSIRVPKSVKEALKEVALEKEPMHLTIQRIIKENENLEKANAKNDELIEQYRFRNSYINKQMDNLRIKSEFLDGIMEYNYGTYNDYLNCYNRLNNVLCDDLSEDEMFNQLKDAYNDCISEIGDDGMVTVINFAKFWCYDEFELLSKLEDYVAMEMQSD